MKYLKIEKNEKLYQFEAKNKQKLIQILEEKKEDFPINEIKFLTSNVFKIKKGENEELTNIFSH
jgi:hypothetical protein